MDFGGHHTESQLEEFFFFVKSPVLVRKKRDVILLMRLNLILVFTEIQTCLMGTDVVVPQAGGVKAV